MLLQWTEHGLGGQAHVGYTPCPTAYDPVFFFINQDLPWLPSKIILHISWSNANGNALWVVKIRQQCAAMQCVDIHSHNEKCYASENYGDWAKGTLEIMNYLSSKLIFRQQKFNLSQNQETSRTMLSNTKSSDLCQGQAAGPFTAILHVVIC